MKEKLIQYKKPLLAAGLLVLLLVLYFYRAKIFKGISSTGTTTVINTSASSSTASEENKVLQRGSNGEAVRQLQLLLNEEHRKHAPTFIPLLEEDGVFGAKTESMLLLYANQSSISLAQLKTKLTKV